MLGLAPLRGAEPAVDHRSAVDLHVRISKVHVAAIGRVPLGDAANPLDRQVAIAEVTPQLGLDDRRVLLRSSARREPEREAEGSGGAQ